jgi:hypothetical protein
MSRVTIELSPQQIAAAVERLSGEEKIRLTERLEKETLKMRWKRILRDIDLKLRRFPISKEEVLKEIQAYRKAKYA